MDGELAAPSWPEASAELVPLLEGRELVTWTVALDRQALGRSSVLHGLTFPDATWHGAMSWGAQV